MVAATESSVSFTSQAPTDEPIDSSEDPDYSVSPGSSLSV